MITLCGMTLLVAIVFLVYNISDQVNRKIGQQNAADSAAISSGGWYARSMNLIAENNVNQARLLALVAVMDSLPLAVEMTSVELENLYATLESSIEKNQQLLPNDQYENVRNNFIKIGFKKIQERLKEQYKLARQLDEAIDSEDELTKENGIDISRVTNWSNRDSSADSFWAAIIAMDNQSTATVEAINSLAQNSAYRFARNNNSQSGYSIPVNLPKFRKDTDFSYFSPVLQDSIKLTYLKDEEPEPFATNHEQRDLVARFENSVDTLRDLEYGLIKLTTGGAIPNPDFEYQYRLGPWMQLYRWLEMSKFINDNPVQKIETFGASDPEIGTQSHTPTEPFNPYVVEYMTYGPYQWALKKIWQTFLNNFNLSNFENNIKKLATVKCARMFGFDKDIKVHYPGKWIKDYTSARIFANEPENHNKIIRTHYYRVVIMSSKSWNSPQWLGDESTFYSRYEDVKPINNPPAEHWKKTYNGWHDISTYLNWVAITGQRKRIANNIWRWSRTRQTDYDPRINIQRIPGKDGKPILQPVFYCSWYVFGGIEIRDEEVSVNNPYDWSDSEKNNRPKPTLLDVSELAGRKVNFQQTRWNNDNEWYELDVNGFKVQPYSLVGVARASSRSAVWSQRFNSANPDKAMTAFARVEIFNNKSWDLWTQDWRVQLVPLLNDTAESDSLKTWSDLASKAEDAIVEIQQYPTTDVPLNVMENVLEYIQSLDTDDNTDELVNH